MQAAERLLELPDIFTTSEYCTLTRQAPATASVMLSRYAGRGLIERLSNRSDVFANRVQGASRQTHLRPMLARVIPGALVTGLSALYEAGWTTQRPTSLHVAVAIRSPGWRHDIPGVTKHSRSASWFAALGYADGGIEGALNQPLATLKPHWALADLLNRGQAPDPDDLEVDLIEDYEEAIQALQTLLPARSVTAKPAPRRRRGPAI